MSPHNQQYGPVYATKGASINIGFLRAVPIAVLAYLALSTGGLGLGADQTLGRIAVTSILLFGFVFAMFRRVGFERAFLVILISLAGFLTFQISRAQDLDIAIDKIDGFLIGGALTYVLFKLGLAKNSFRFLNGYAFVSLLVLFMTVAYKFQFGFFDRQVRFFLNGPITFGWLMSMSALISLYLASVNKQASLYFVFLAFATAIFWTGSKGPLIGLFLSSVYLLFVSGRLSRNIFIVLLSFVLIYMLGQFGLIPERLLAIQNIFTGQGANADFDSIGIRGQMLVDSFGIFQSNPITGVGIGNWAFNTGSPEYFQLGLYYPHNLIAEMASEFGVVGLLVFVGALLFCISRCGALGASLVILFVICLSFSGDMSYWRFLFFIPLAIGRVRQRHDH